MFLAILFIIAGLFNSESWVGMAMFAMGMIMLTIAVKKQADEGQVQSLAVPKEKQCPPHKWVYGSDGFLVCDLCKQRPGDIPSSYDKPY